MAVSDTERVIITAAIAAVTSVVVALLGVFFSARSGRRDRRRELYGEATRAALLWIELLYRVRRRADDASDARAIVQRFHSAQEDLTYHKGWIGSESRYVARSFAKLVRAVKTETEQLIRDAWGDPIRPIPGNAVTGDVHPNVDVQLEAFLRDVRAHLSSSPIRKLMMMWRNSS